ncbi:hypothetical protein QFC19_004210 [Naganishia cerealis]|uniref:Uncharacterized protein n=1 Tax=Naganishia cerealis TaxID=610337 RepID=A0ACC2VXP0_9TREE|nr:hypothetical protein QFC19_004210 [Naganishia cerealis]
MGDSQRSSLQPFGSGEEDMRVQDVGPPEWRSVLNFNHDFGYPDFFPSRPGFRQPEDVVTGINVRQGFQGVNVVAAGVESVSVHAAISDRLKKANIFQNVNTLAVEILKARRDQAPVLPESAYRLPNRVVYNESMKKSFLNDLSDESIPLNSPKFAKSVPHGMKGLDLLEMLWSRRIQVDRAIWLVHILGVHEVQNLRRGYDPAKNPFSPNQQYSTIFTEAVTSFLSKQISELTAIHDKLATTDGVPQEAVSWKRAWVQKWEYTQDLMQELLHRNLLDVRSLGMWIRDTVQSVRLSALPLVLDYLERMASFVFEDNISGVCIIATLIRKLDEVTEHPARSALQPIEQRLASLIRLAWYRDQGLFLLPQSWDKHKAVLRKVLRSTLEHDPQALAYVQARNAQMLYYRVKPESGATETDDIQKISQVGLKPLDSYDGSDDFEHLCAAYFLPPGSDDISPDVLRNKLAILLDWGVKQNRLQPHRPYLVAKLLKYLIYSPGAPKAVNPAWLTSYLMSWADKSANEVAGHSSAPGTQPLLSELFNHKLVDFEVYLQRMIASGRTYRQSDRSQHVSQYLNFVAQLQVVHLSEPVATLRENVIYGFSSNASRVSAFDNVQLAMGMYLKRSSDITNVGVLYERPSVSIPDLLLEIWTPALSEGCWRQIANLRSIYFTTRPLDFTVRLLLLIHLFERQRNYRAMCYLLTTCLKLCEGIIFKPVDDAMKRHRLLIICFEDEFPELTRAVRQQTISDELVSPNSSVLPESFDSLQSQIERMQPKLSMIDYQTLERLQQASRHTHTMESLSTLWMMTLEMVSRLRAFETNPQTICLVAGIWTAITRSSTRAWDSLLRQWSVDAGPASPMFAGTSALCIELLLRGSLDASVLWNKLIYPFIGAPLQMNSNTAYLQPVASLCFRLLPNDDTTSGTMHNLMLSSAVNAGFAKMSESSFAMSGFLQRLPSVCLLLNDTRATEGTKVVYKLAGMPQLQTVATKYISMVKNAFASAIAQVPEKQALFESILRILLAQPQESSPGSALGRTDWRSLITLTSSDSVSSLFPATTILSASDAKNVVVAAVQLLLDDSASTWWRMCTSMTTQTLLALHVATCQLVYDMLYHEGGLTRNDLRRMEHYLSIMEIARSCNPDLESLTWTDSMEQIPWNVLQGLLTQLENGVLRLPSELYARLLSLVTSIICMTKSQNVSTPEIQLRILRCLELLRANLPVEYKTNMVLLHFQGSVSLLQFGARLTGDRVAQQTDKMQDNGEVGGMSPPWSHFVSERDIGISPTGESVYLRNSASGLSTSDGGTSERLELSGTSDALDQEMTSEVQHSLADVIEVSGSSLNQVRKIPRPQSRKRVKVTFRDESGQA